ncbi:MAG: FHA domain-containing protein [Acidobacteriota bacterium]|nr:FHA domain-containing protein [Acidobacteriota bacterium]
MTELWLKFKDANGDDKRISVEREKFVVGRHSENDLSIADGRLSRQHIKIERFADIFVVSDCGSSNGTTLNDKDLTEPVGLKNEDKLNLGGGLEIEVEIVSDDPNANNSSADGSGKDSASAEAENSSGGSSVQAAADSNGNSFPTAILLLIPVLGIFVLLVAGGLFLALSGKSENETVKSEGGFVYSSTRNSTVKETASTDETPTPKSPDKTTSTTITSASPTVEIENETATTPSSKTSSDAEKTVQNSAAFLRHIALNDPKAFLTDKQAEAVGAKINQLKSSAALAENLKSVKKNSAQFSTLASSQNMKPQFLAIAALAKIGNQRGDALAVAGQMLPVLGELKITLDNKLADDNLLIIAGYERGAAGNARALQSVLEALSKQTQNVSPREIRTIWFLKQQGKITDAEYNFALDFLAIGTIAQNPKDFGVSADALTF